MASPPMKGGMTSGPDHTEDPLATPISPELVLVDPELARHLHERDRVRAQKRTPPLPALHLVVSDVEQPSDDDPAPEAVPDVPLELVHAPAEGIADVAAVRELDHVPATETEPVFEPAAGDDGIDDAERPLELPVGPAEEPIVPRPALEAAAGAIVNEPEPEPELGGEPELDAVPLLQLAPIGSLETTSEAIVPKPSAELDIAADVADESIPVEHDVEPPEGAQLVPDLLSRVTATSGPASPQPAEIALEEATVEPSETASIDDAETVLPDGSTRKKRRGRWVVAIGALFVTGFAGGVVVLELLGDVSFPAF
jgi:hypothetical protein